MTAHAPKEDVGSHTTDFGAYGDDPLSRSVGAATEMSQAATTSDLAAGTARSTKQLPGMACTPPLRSTFLGIAICIHADTHSLWHCVS